MYSKLILKRIVIKYSDWLINPDLLNKTSTQTLVIFPKQSIRVFSGSGKYCSQDKDKTLIRSSPLLPSSGLLQYKAFGFYSNKRTTLQQSSWNVYRTIYQTTPCGHPGHNGTSKGDNSDVRPNTSEKRTLRKEGDGNFSSAENYIQESPELKDILKDLYEENDLGKSHVVSETTKGKI